MRNNTIDLLKTIAIIIMLYLHITIWLHNQDYSLIISGIPYIVGKIGIPIFFFCSGASVYYSDSSFLNKIVECLMVFLLGMVLSTIDYYITGIFYPFGALQIISINKILLHLNKNKSLINWFFITTLYFIFIIVTSNFFWILFPLGFIYASHYKYKHNIEMKFRMSKLSLTIFVSHSLIFGFPFYLLGLYQSFNIIIVHIIFIISILFYYIWSKFPIFTLEKILKIIKILKLYKIQFNYIKV